MERLRRWTINFTVLASTLLCLAAGFLWRTSYRVYGHYGRTVDEVVNGEAYETRSGWIFGAGRINFVSTRLPSSDLRTVPPAPGDRFGWSVGSFEEFVAERDESFALGFGSNGSSDEYSVESIPFWFVTLVLSAPLFIWLAWRKTSPALQARLIEAYCALLVWGILFFMMTGVLGILPTIGLVAYVTFRVLYLCCIAIYERSSPANLQYACARCGYDLRATPSRCPECGSMPRVTQAKVKV